MLFQEQAVSRALSATGQVILRPVDIDMPAETVSADFFVPCVREHEKYRPPDKSILVEISNGFYTLPSDCKKVIGLENILTYQGVQLPFVRITPFRWNQVGNVLEAPLGRFRLEYIASFTLKRVLTNYVIWEDIAEQGNLVLTLPTVLIGKSLVFSDGFRTANDSTGTLTGNLVSAGSVISLDARTVTLNLAQATQGP